MTLQVQNLVGGYNQVPVLKDISFDVDDGQLVGLIGLNGAGKSTTINHIIGLLTPISGSIKINGKTLSQNVELYKKSIAYIPETPILYDELTLKEHIEMTIMAYGLDAQKAWEKANHILKIFRLDKRLDWFPSNFSKGMKQKVMITCAFITNANLFIIDEPFLGLDPLATKDLLELIDDVKNQGAAILMSTHVLATAQEVCDKFVMIDSGQIMAQGTLEEIRNENGKDNSSLSDIYLSMAKG